VLAESATDPVIVEKNRESEEQCAQVMMATRDEKHLQRVKEQICLEKP